MSCPLRTIIYQTLKLIFGAYMHTLLMRFFSDNLRDSASSFDWLALILLFTTSNYIIKKYYNIGFFFSFSFLFCFVLFGLGGDYLLSVSSEESMSCNLYYDAYFNHEKHRKLNIIQNSNLLFRNDVTRKI